MKDGGPAFPMPSVPEPRVDEFTHYNEGLSVRDYFAAHSDIPWNAVIETLALVGNSEPTVEEVLTIRAGMRYREADAMMKAREQ